MTAVNRLSAAEAIARLGSGELTAEGLMRAFHGDEVDVVSAGSRAAGWVHPLAIGALAEIGIVAGSVNVALLPGPVRVTEGGALLIAPVFPISSRRLFAGIGVAVLARRLTSARKFTPLNRLRLNDPGDQQASATITLRATQPL